MKKVFLSIKTHKATAMRLCILVSDVGSHRNCNILKEVSEISYPCLKIINVNSNNIVSVEGIHRIDFPALK